MPLPQDDLDTLISSLRADFGGAAQSPAAAPIEVDPLPGWEPEPAALRAAPKSYFDYQAEPPVRQNTGALGDLGTSVKRGVQGIPGAFTGLADIALAGLAVIPKTVGGAANMVGITNTLADDVNQPWASKAADWLGEQTGFQPGQWADEAKAEYSLGKQATDAAKQQAWDEGRYGDYAATIAGNPIDTVGNMLAESLPLMVAGGGLARGALWAASAKQALAATAPRLAKYIPDTFIKKYALGIGEGGITAGVVMDQLTEQDVDPGRAALMSLGAGVTTGALGVAGGRLAQRAGLEDFDATLAGTARAATARTGLPADIAALAAQPTKRGLATRIAGGAAIEGVAEELPQSMSEQMWQNAATGTDLMQGVAQQGIEGMLAGAAMGGGFNAMRRVPPAPGATPATDPGADPEAEQAPADLAARQSALQAALGAAPGADDAIPDFTPAPEPPPVAPQAAPIVLTPPADGEKPSKKRKTPAINAFLKDPVAAFGVDAQTKIGAEIGAANDAKVIAVYNKLDPKYAHEQAFRAAIEALAAQRNINLNPTEEIPSGQETNAPQEPQGEAQPVREDAPGEGRQSSDAVPGGGQSQEGLLDTAAPATAPLPTGVPDVVQTPSTPAVQESPAMGGGTGAAPASDLGAAAAPGALAGDPTVPAPPAPQPAPGAIDPVVDEAAQTAATEAQVLPTVPGDVPGEPDAARGAGVISQADVTSANAPRFVAQEVGALINSGPIGKTINAYNHPDTTSYRDWFLNKALDALRAISTTKSTLAKSRTRTRNGKKFTVSMTSAIPADKLALELAASGVSTKNLTGAALFNQLRRVIQAVETDPQYTHIRTALALENLYGTAQGTAESGVEPATDEGADAVVEPTIAPSAQDLAGEVVGDTKEERAASRAEQAEIAKETIGGLAGLDTESIGSGYEAGNDSAEGGRADPEFDRGAAYIQAGLHSTEKKVGMSGLEITPRAISQWAEAARANGQNITYQEAAAELNDLDDQAQEDWLKKTSPRGGLAQNELNQVYLATKQGATPFVGETEKERDARVRREQMQVAARMWAGVGEDIIPFDDLSVVFQGRLFDYKQAIENLPEYMRKRALLDITEDLRAEGRAERDNRAAAPADNAAPATPKQDDGAGVPGVPTQRAGDVTVKSRDQLIKEKRAARAAAAQQASGAAEGSPGVVQQGISEADARAIVGSVLAGSQTLENVVLERSPPAERENDGELSSLDRENLSALRHIEHNARIPGDRTAATNLIKEFRAAHAASAAQVEGAAQRSVMVSAKIREFIALRAGIRPREEKWFARGKRRMVRATTVRHNGRRTIYLYLDNLSADQVLPTLMHELVHLNHRPLMQFVAQIKALAAGQDQSLEAQLARRAQERVAQSRTPPEARDEELVAYFVDEAVRAGANPRTGAGAPVQARGLFQQIWNALRAVLRQMGLYKTDHLTAQHIVDLTHALAMQSQFERVQDRSPAENRDATANPYMPPIAQAGKHFWDIAKTESAHAWANWGPALFTLDQLAKRFPLVKPVTDLLAKIEQYATKRIAVAAGVEQDWSQIPQAMQDRLSLVMSDARRLQFDPAAHAALVKAAGPVPTLTADEAALYAKFKALDAKARATFTAVLDYYQKDLQERLAVVKELRDQVAAAENIKKTAGGDELLKSLTNTLEKAPKVYFPFKRLGNYHVVAMSTRVAELMRRALLGTQDVDSLTAAETKELAQLKRNPSHYRVAGTNWAFQAKALHDQWAKDPAFAGPDPDFRVYYDRNTYHPHAPAMAGIAAVGEFRTRMEGKGLTPEAVNEAVQQFQQVMFELLPEGHALKQGISASLASGEERDMRAVFAQTARSSAHMLARLKYAQQLSEAMTTLKNSGRGSVGGADHQDATTIYNEMAMRAGSALQFTESPFANALYKLSAFSMLGASPAFLLVNLHQVPVVSLPWIAARLGGAASKDTGKTAKALYQAAKDISKGIAFTKTGGAGGLMTGDAEGRVEFDSKVMAHLKPAEQAYLKHLEEIDQLGSTMEMGLAGEAGTAGRRLRNFMRTVTLPMQAGEILNRGTTGLAAFRLALEKFNGDVIKATAFADEAVVDTQVNYHALNTPRAMQSVLGSKPLAHLVFQFWKYRQAMLYMTFSSFMDSYFRSGVSAEEKAAAKRTWKGLFATTMLSAGVFEAPLVSGTLGAASLLAGLGGGDDDEPIDFERDARNFLHDALGPEVGELFGKGAWSLAGVDMSKRVGMGDLANPFSFAKFGGTSGRDDAAAGLMALAGAPASTIATMVDGVYKLGEGDYQKALTALVPLKGIKDVLRAKTLAEEGVTTRTGETVLAPEQISTGAVLARGAGLQPLQTSRYYEGNAAVQTAFKAATGARKRLIAQFAQASQRGESTADALEQIQRFNARHPDQTLRIDGDTLKRAIKARRQVAIERGPSGVGESRQLRPFLDQGRFANVPE